MSTINLRLRSKAAAIHLSGSALVAAAAAVLVYGVWYPFPYQVLAGGTGLFLLITSVDVVIGPCLTFAVFAPEKGLGRLKFDLCVIVALQLAALVYGLHTMFQARPVVLALETDRFRVVTAADVFADELRFAPASLRTLSWRGPLALRTVVPTDPQQSIEAVELALAGYDLGTRPRFWQPWDEVARGEVLLAARPLADLEKKYPARSDELRRIAQEKGISIDTLGFLPVLSKHADWVALVDRRVGEVVGFAPFDGY